ncbi:glycerate kinase [Anaerolineales bacterium HSG24]|nr:glycerate kinase [Anaerolineales bacterium HSG24]
MKPSAKHKRQIAWNIMRPALQAVDPETAINTYFDENPALVEQIQDGTGNLYVIGAGKASAPMAVAVQTIFGSKIKAGRVIVKYGHTQPLPAESTISLIEAAHPVPDQAGLDATRDLTTMLQHTQAEDTVLCLISGGGSALFTQPADGLTLADLQQTNQILLGAGVPIQQINSIRKHLSAIKGGRLAELIAPATLYSLILSDVVGDPLAVIASGPTVPDPTRFADAWRIVEQYQLRHQLPATVVAHLQAGCTGTISDTPKPDNPIFANSHTAIIGSNRIAAQAAVSAAQNMGFEAQLLTTFVEGEAREVAQVMAGLAKGLARDESSMQRPACLILGGETTVTIQGDGLGGRNQEMALAVAIALQGWPNVLIACLGTDGNDGPTPAAGAFADGETVIQATRLGLDAIEYLRYNNAYNFFNALDDLIITGPTNTNVNDLIIILVW